MVLESLGETPTIYAQEEPHTCDLDQLVSPRESKFRASKRQWDEAGDAFNRNSSSRGYQPYRLSQHGSLSLGANQILVSPSGKVTSVLARIPLCQTYSHQGWALQNAKDDGKGA